ncbi:MAG: hypothetical protein A3K10_02750 [Bacteroidetes bacterium RIFCSPLOWO2_12_FULL_31_6]|nr:MAG: hypothetical protein A3K10_02750 [Bacteroidetes bacterium RIFCSPLOWO2_12_FULL_31_6]
MKIERTQNEIIFHIPSNIDIDQEILQRMIDYIAYKNAISKSKATQKDVDSFVKQIKKGWGKKHREKHLK